MAIVSVTCFKCWGDTALLTYEENRIYKVSCPCGCSYTFEHSSMRAAEEYHCKMIELYAEIDKNSKLREEIAALKAENERLKDTYRKLERALSGIGIDIGFWTKEDENGWDWRD